MEILYISSVPSAKGFQHIRSASRPGYVYGMPEAGYRFHTLIIEGLCAHPEVRVRALVCRPVGSRTHRGLIWKRVREQTSERLRYDHLGLINLPVIKQLGLGIQVFFHILSWANQTKAQERAIVLDGAYVTALPFIMLAKRIGRCPAAAIFCDIYDYMADVKDARGYDKPSILHRLLSKITGRCYRSLDGFVLLTEAMRPVVNKAGRPYIIMEGLVDPHTAPPSKQTGQEGPGPVVMYAGALREQYGLKNLVDGFMKYKNDAARLWIFGEGDYSDAVREASERDPRIVFGGFASQQEIWKKEREATLLVNPRPIGQEFTKYSFPSKNMEYMASGTPLLTTRLPGIPQGYYDYIYTIDGDTPGAVTSALESVLGQTADVLYQKGMSAREFVLREKNNVLQAGRILSLLRQMTADDTPLDLR